MLDEFISLANCGGGVIKSRDVSFLFSLSSAYRDLIVCMNALAGREALALGHLSLEL